MRQNTIKLWTALVLICLMFTTMTAIPSQAAASPVITASSVKAQAGGTATVIISLDNNPGIFSLGLRVGYDKNVLILNKCEDTSKETEYIFKDWGLIQPLSLDNTPCLFTFNNPSIENATKTGTFLALTFTVKANATLNDYPITLEMDSGNTINVDSQEVEFTTVNGKVSVVNCIHETKTWTTVIAATCDKGGTENSVCNRCKEVLATRAITAKGHSFTKMVISDATKRDAATTTNKATYYFTCKNCGVISDKLYFSSGDLLVYKIVSGENSDWQDELETGLTFTADGKLEDFTELKIDSKLIDPTNYETKSGSTIITLKTEFLKTLEAGDHKLTIVYTNGETSTDFKITKTVASSIASSVPSNSVDSESKDSSNRSDSNNNTILIILLVILIAGLGAGAFYFIKRKR